MPEVGLAAAVVRQRRVVHDLQQDVVDVGVRLFDLVEQDHGVRVRPHGVDEEAALLEADVAGRGADQPRHRVLLHVLAHVVAHELVPEVQRELAGQLRLADAGRTGEQEAAGRPVGLAEPGARALDRRHHGAHRFFLTEDDALQRLLERAQPLLVGGGRLLLRDASHPRHDALDLAGRHLGHFRVRFAVGRPLHRQHGPRLVDHVDGAVGQPKIAQVPLGESRRRGHRIVRVGHLVVGGVARLQSGQDLRRLVDGRLLDGDALEPPGQGPVLLDVLELVEGGRSDHAQLARREHRLDQGGEVHRAAGRGAGPHRRVHLVDEEDRQRPLREGGNDRLEALLEVAAEPRAGEERRGVEGEDLGAGQRSGDVVLEQPRRQPLRERGLADAGVADEDGVVLAAPAEDLPACAAAPPSGR